MAKTIQTSAEESSGRPDTPTQQKTTTNWGAFDKARLAPTEIMCQAYAYGAADMSCHTRLVPDPAVLGNHVKAEHGGGFRLTLRKADKVWPGWKKFEEAGLEAHDFRCDICDAEVPFHPGHILKHMKPHQGKIKKTRPGGVFNITLGYGLPDLPDIEAFESELEA